MGTFPGYNDWVKFKDWEENTLTPISDWTKFIWSVFNIVSTLLTIFGICKILSTLNELKRSNQRIETKNLTLTVHSVVLVLHLVACIFRSLPSRYF